MLTQLAFRAADQPWTLDNGCKWLLAAHGEDGLRSSLPYMGRTLDPELRFVPISRPFAKPIDGRLVSQYPPTFSLLSKPWIDLFGTFGGYLLPLLGALLAAWGTGRLAAVWTSQTQERETMATLLDPGGPGTRVVGIAFLWAWLFAGPLGPLAWYGTTFWEHTLVAAAVVWGTVFWTEAIHSRPPNASRRRSSDTLDVSRRSFTDTPDASPRRSTDTSGVSQRSFTDTSDASPRSFTDTPDVSRDLVLAAGPLGSHDPARMDSEAGLRDTPRRTLLRVYPLLSGLLFALGTWLREETGVVFLALAVCTLFTRRPRPSIGQWAAFVGTYALLLLPFLLWLRWITGSVWGIHLTENLQGSFLTALVSDRVRIIRSLLFSGDEGWTEAGGLILVLLTVVVAAVVARVSSTRVRSWGVGAVGAVVGGVALLCILALHGEPDMPLTLVRTEGLFFFAPWVVWCFAARRARFPAAAWTGPLAALLFLFLTPPNSALGFHWGPRILLTTLPLLAAVAALGFSRLWVRSVGPVSRLGAALVVLGCFSLQVYGGTLQARVTHGAKEYLGRTREVLRAADDAPVVTHHWWYASTFAPLLTDRPVHRVRNRVDLGDWVQLFEKAGGERFYWATSMRNDQILNRLPVRVVGSTEMEGYPVFYRHRLVEVVLLEMTSP